MSGLPVLYSFRRCPYAIREVKLSAKPGELIAVSPKATVSVLVLPDGRVIDQSLARADNAEHRDRLRAWYIAPIL